MNWITGFAGSRSSAWHSRVRTPLVLDLQGSKWRLGLIPEQVLAPDQTVELVLAEKADQPGRLPVPHADFFLAAQVSSSQIVLNDGKIRLHLVRAGEDMIWATVIKGGAISARKGITYADSSYRMESLSEKDFAIFTRSRSIEQIRFAISYVRDVTEMEKYRQIFERPAYLIAKLERLPAVDQALEIAAVADELWLCRGDLGAELGLRAMAEAVHRFSQQLHKIPVPAILAGQVLEHLTLHSSPTRSEVCFLFDALMNGYKGVVLSDETAIGKFPVESVTTAAIYR